MLDRAKHVICISQNNKIDLFRLYDTLEGKISVVLLGFDHFFAVLDVKEDCQISPRPFLFYVGARGDYKNFTGLLRAVASSSKLLKDFGIVAFGGGKFSATE